jgi:aryl-alcohol dehydrogenase-like predicted oxidoreductase
MQKRKLGGSDLDITRIGIGTWAIGGPEGRFNWGPQDDEESVGAIRRALELGVNWVDTAPAYGLGHSEEVVARALEGVTPKPYVFTKCSLAWGEDRVIRNVLKAASIRRECEDSLRRLRLETIDLMQVHWPNPDADIEEGWVELARLQKEGKVRWIGVSNFSVPQMKRAQAIASLTSLQPPYSAVKRFAEKELLPFCQENGIGVIVYSPMQAGLLSGRMTRERVASLAPGDWRRGSPDFQEPNLTRNLALQDLFGKIGARHGHPAAVAALAWVLRRPDVTGAIVGSRRPSQVDDFIAAGDFRLSPEEVDEVARFIEKTV